MTTTPKVSLPVMSGEAPKQRQGILKLLGRISGRTATDHQEVRDLMALPPRPEPVEDG